jgi:hypothetical protein
MTSKYRTSEGGEAMPNNREVAAAFGLLMVGWFVLGHILGFYIGPPAFFICNDFVTYRLQDTSRLQKIAAKLP